VRSFLSCIDTIAVQLDDRVSRNEMSVACNMNGGDQKSIGLWWGNLKVRTTWKNLDIDGRIILKWISSTMGGLGLD
jgi:hypothetical protein